MRIRLTPDQRRRQIVEAAMPLFARKGFSGVTTKEVAEAAKVSEGLLFKYFATRTALYDAIITYCFRGDDERFATLENLPPSTAALAAIVGHIVDYFVSIKTRSALEQSRQRLFLQSLVEDGEFARFGMNAFAECLVPLMQRSFAAARQAGDVTAQLPVPRAFWLSAMLQTMLGAFALHDGMNADGTGPQEWTIDATKFILRGMGIKADVVDAVCRPYDLMASAERHRALHDVAIQNKDSFIRPPIEAAART